MSFLEKTYGLDLLSLTLLFIACILNLIPYTRILSLVIIIYALYRAFSKKIYKRKEEFNIFCTFANKILNKFGKSIPYNLPVYNLNNFTIYFSYLKKKFDEFKKYKITKCPNCKQKLRLPKGKGNIVVTCKRCSTRFDFRT